MRRVLVRQFEETLEVPEGDTILDAALDEGWDFPFFCRGGTCGKCKSLLVSGEVELKPYAHFALPDSEREAGYVLACRAVPLTDCEIAIAEDEEGP